jgi:hypothetical protein
MNLTPTEESLALMLFTLKALILYLEYRRSLR